MSESKRNDPNRIELPETTGEPASRTVHRQVRATSYVVMLFSYGAKGELLSVVRMPPDSGPIGRHECFHYSDPDAA